MMLVAPVAVTLRRLQCGEIITEGAFKIVVVRSGPVWFSKHNHCSTHSVRLGPQSILSMPLDSKI